MHLDTPSIAIIGGTGKEGTGLAMRWGAAGYRVLIGSRQAEKAHASAEKINQQLGRKSATGMLNLEAARQAEICVLTVEHTAHLSILESLREQIIGKILVDATSRVDYRNPIPPESPSAAQQAQDFLGSSVRVVGAFQNVPAKSLYKNIGEPLDAEVLVCSDDQDAANQVILLAEAAGMRGYYAGSLKNAIVVEGLTCLLISINKRYGVNNASIKIIGVPER